MERAPDGLRAWIDPAHVPVGIVGHGTESEIALAEGWLRSRGCTRARGPIEGSTWYAYRANLGPHAVPPFFGEPSATAEPWLARGYTPVAHYTSNLADSEKTVERGFSIAARTQGHRLRALMSSDREGELRMLHALSVKGFQRQFAYSPIGLDDFKALYEPWWDALDHDFVLVAETPSGEPEGFCFALRQPGETFVIKSLVVLAEARSLGLGNWLVAEIHRKALERGFRQGIHALMWTESRSQGISEGTDAFRRYALYERDLG